MDPDYNRFDSFQPVMAHTKMTHGEWLGTYRAAWRDFYSVEGMKSILSRANVRTYWGLFKNFCWYRYANLVEDTLDVVFAVGGGIPVKGDPWKSFFMANALLNLHAGPAYVAGGLGYSTKERVGRLGGIDLVGELGINLFRSEDSIGSILGELRVPIITTDRDFDHHHKLLLGFRYIF